VSGSVSPQAAGKRKRLFESRRQRARMNIRPDHSHTRLAAATILHLLPDAHEKAALQNSINVIRQLRAAGSRCLVATQGGRQASTFKAAGAELVDLAFAKFGPLATRRNSKKLENLIASERIDIVHAFGVSESRAALVATERLAVWLVTSLPDYPARGLRALGQSVLGQGDRVIASSAFAAATMIERLRIARDRIVIVPHPIDLDRFNTAAVARENVKALRKKWGLPDGERAIAVLCGDDREACRITLDAAQVLFRAGLSGITFVFVTETPAQEKAARGALKRSPSELQSRIKIAVPSPRELPAALAACDIAIVPALQPSPDTALALQAQAMARPVIASACGALPECLLAPPRMRNDLRTGWLVQPGDAKALADILRDALEFDLAEYRALAARARQFAEFMFSPQSTAARLIGVYDALLTGG
jgi:glycosyltransferase involved in cell wall biosynthesis